MSNESENEDVKSIECDLTREELIDECVRLWEGLTFILSRVKGEVFDTTFRVKYGWRISELLDCNEYMKQGGQDIINSDVVEHPHSYDFVPDFVKQEDELLPIRKFYWNRIEEDIQEREEIMRKYLLKNKERL